MRFNSLSIFLFEGVVWACQHFHGAPEGSIKAGSKGYPGLFGVHIEMAKLVIIWAACNTGTVYLLLTGGGKTLLNINSSQRKQGTRLACKTGVQNKTFRLLILILSGKSIMTCMYLPRIKTYLDTYRFFCFFLGYLTSLVSGLLRSFADVIPHWTHTN